MQIFLDDKPVDVTWDAESSVEDAMRQVQSDHCAPDDLVIGLRCDGNDVAADAMGETLSQPVANFERLDVFTGHRTVLVADAMEQAAKCLTDTSETCQRVAEFLTEGKTVDAAEALGKCLQIWQQIHEAVAKSVEMLGIDPERLTVNDVTLSELITRPKEVLLQVRNALQSQDFVLLADILKYEFGEVTDQWHEVVGRIRQESARISDERQSGASVPQPDSAS